MQTSAIISLFQRAVVFLRLMAFFRVCNSNITQILFMQPLSCFSCLHTVYCELLVVSFVISPPKFSWLSSWPGWQSIGQIYMAAAKGMVLGYVSGNMHLCLINSNHKTFSVLQTLPCEHVLLGTCFSFDKNYCYVTLCLKCQFFLTCHHSLRFYDSLEVKRHKVA